MRCRVASSSSSSSSLASQSVQAVPLQRGWQQQARVRSQPASLSRAKKSAKLCNIIGAAIAMGLKRAHISYHRSAPLTGIAPPGCERSPPGGPCYTPRPALCRVASLRACCPTCVGKTSSYAQNLRSGGDLSQPGQAILRSTGRRSQQQPCIVIRDDENGRPINSIVLRRDEGGATRPARHALRAISGAGRGGKRGGASAGEGGGGGRGKIGLLLGDRQALDWRVIRY
eukprot:COSAG06_NODE_497_length_15020_cov_7.417733_17_plen_228_part_00